MLPGRAHHPACGSGSADTTAAHTVCRLPARPIREVVALPHLGDVAACSAEVTVSFADVTARTLGMS